MSNILRGPLPIHFILFALYPIISLYSENSSEMQFSDTYRAIVIVTMGSAVLFLLLQSVSKNSHRASAMVSLCIVLFFSYGHIYSIIKGLTVGIFVIGRHRYLITLWLFFLIGGAWLLLRRVVWVNGATRILNIMSVILIALPAVLITSDNFLTIKAPQKEELVLNDQLLPQNYLSEDLLPDIYYIIVDAYARNDILSHQFGFDNREFHEFLNSRGFYIADQSTSNYLWTHLSLVSSLNMNYIPDIIPNWEQGSKIEAGDFIKDSLVRRNLESWGYSTVAFATGWQTTELFDADYILTPNKTKLEELYDKGSFNQFEGMLLHTSMLKILVDYDAINNTPVANFVAQRLLIPFEHQREIILAQFDNLAKTPYIPGPKFVFVHIISPHEPYLFGPNGEVVEQSGPFTLAQTTGKEVDEKVNLYLDQLRFITTKLEETIDDLISISERPLIIILQSDHGPGLNLEWENPDTMALKDKMSILNAYYVPQECRAELYETITPVNTFRIISNCIFGETYQLVEDVTYFGVTEFYNIKELFDFTN